jgi:hypothetical protein
MQERLRAANRRIGCSERERAELTAASRNRHRDPCNRGRARCFASPLQGDQSRVVLSERELWLHGDALQLVTRQRQLREDDEPRAVRRRGLHEVRVRGDVGVDVAGNGSELRGDDEHAPTG